MFSAYDLSIFNRHLFWAIPLTVLAYFLASKISLKIKNPLFNTMLMTVLFIALFLLLFHIPYDKYFQGNQLIHQSLQFGIVALAFPLYRQTPNILALWKIIPLACFLGSFLAMISGVLIVFLCGGDKTIAASVLAKSVTTPIALVLTREVGGIEAIAVACVVIVGIFGAVFGHFILNICGIKNKSARGLAIGATSHAIGTGRCTEVCAEEAAYSSLALVLCGFFTAITASFVFTIMAKFLY
ncbi:MAG: LrgB family protein [Cardiobacteriaceae bacterium]|nr:LrgB family protein [Cardiobacteriaceae bacterium]